MPSKPPNTLNTLIQECATVRNLAAFQRLAAGWLPVLLGLAGHYFEKPHLEKQRLEPVEHREAVCRDTLLLAWRNLPDSFSDNVSDHFSDNASDNHVSGNEAASQWLYRIFGSVLYNRLLAIHGSELALLQWLGTRYSTPLAEMASPTGPRPALFSGEQLAILAEQTAPEAPSQQLQQQTERLIQAEIAQRTAPRTPTGERAHPLLYDPRLRRRMLRSRAAFRFKEGFKRNLGRPLEDWLFQRWLNDKPGSAALERQGLPRRSVEAYLDVQLDIDIDPRTLQRGLSYPKSFPDRALRRKVSNSFLWSGDWDLPTPRLSDTPRQHFIDDIWRHRLDLSASDNYARLLQKLEQGQPLSLHHQGILLNSPERILGYLDQYRLYMEDMSCFGFKAEQGKDRLGVAIDRNGSLIKSRQGLRRLAMAHTLGLQRITVRVRAVHQRWWQHQIEGTKGTKGKEAMYRLSNSIAGL